MVETAEVEMQEVSTETPQVSPELLDELREANEDYHKALLESNLSGEIHKGKKKVLETAQTALNEVCDAITRGAVPLPLFDWANEPEIALWMDVPLAHLFEPGIPDRYLTALADNEPPILTLGDLTNWQSEKGDFWVKDVKGLGEGGQVAIDEATAGYWEHHPQTQEPVTDDPTTEEN